MDIKYQKVVFLDLDGTLLDNDYKISTKNYDSLIDLGKRNILRVVATGRSMHSIYHVLHNDFPIDYCIFSTGAGILNWNTKKIIKHYFFSYNDIKSITDFLIKKDLDFMLHFSIPDNHKYYVYKSRNIELNNDFYSRCSIYDGYTFSLDLNVLPDKASQFLIITKKEKNFELYEEIKKYFPNYKIVITTSPIDKKSSWIEIFPKKVSKGLAANFLSKKLKILVNHTMAIGNDYNDVDLLDWAQFSCIVENAPDDLKVKYNLVPSNEDDGFFHAVNIWIDKY